MLGLRIDADRPTELVSQLLRERDHLVEGRHLELSVPGMRSERQPLARAQRLDFGEREVLGEPSGDRHPIDRLRPLAVRELHRGVRGAADLVLMARDEHAVLRRDEIGFDVVGAHLGGEPIAGERVLGPMPGCTSVSDDDRRLHCRRHGNRHTCSREHGNSCNLESPHHPTLTRVQVITRV